mmetsp:Transcript_102973/g.297765  ORF Transcript_102973/g.297765 Transcript_102973/m.297765 type:complete len:469 (+) Transcript_102973:558-1964(+)
MRVSVNILRCLKARACVEDLRREVKLRLNRIGYLEDAIAAIALPRAELLKTLPDIHHGRRLLLPLCQGGCKTARDPLVASVAPAYAEHARIPVLGIHGAMLAREVDQSPLRVRSVPIGHHMRLNDRLLGKPRVPRAALDQSDGVLSRLLEEAGRWRKASRRGWVRRHPGNHLFLFLGFGRRRRRRRRVRPRDQELLTPRSSTARHHLVAWAVAPRITQVAQLVAQDGGRRWALRGALGDGCMTPPTVWSIMGARLCRLPCSAVIMQHCSTSQVLGVVVRKAVRQLGCMHPCQHGIAACLVVALLLRRRGGVNHLNHFRRHATRGRGPAPGCAPPRPRHALSGEAGLPPLCCLRWPQPDNLRGNTVGVIGLVRHIGGRDRALGPRRRWRHDRGRPDTPARWPLRRLWRAVRPIGHSLVSLLQAAWRCGVCGSRRRHIRDKFRRSPKSKTAADREAERRRRRRHCREQRA